MHRLGKNKTEREYVVYLAAATLNVHMCQRPIANIQTYEESAKKAKKNCCTPRLHSIPFAS